MLKQFGFPGFGAIEAAIYQLAGILQSLGQYPCSHRFTVAGQKRKLALQLQRRDLFVAQAFFAGLFPQLCAVTSMAEEDAGELLLSLLPG